MKLPKRRFHQDYYEEIKRPIAMSVIKNHIKVILISNQSRNLYLIWILERRIYRFS